MLYHEDEQVLEVIYTPLQKDDKEIEREFSFFYNGIESISVDIYWFQCTVNGNFSKDRWVFMNQLCLHLTQCALLICR